MILRTTPNLYGLYKFSIGDEIPKGVELSDFYAICQGGGELSVFCQESAEMSAAVSASEGWRLFVYSGQVSPDNFGVVARISSVLAQKSISVLVFTTYDYGYFAVPVQSVVTAEQALKIAGIDRDSA